MRLIAILFPVLYFFLTLRWLRAVIALILMCTVVGWLPASLWALSVYNEASTDKKFKKLDRKLSQMAS